MRWVSRWCRVPAVQRLSSEETRCGPGITASMSSTLLPPLVDGCGLVAVAEVDQAPEHQRRRCGSSRRARSPRSRTRSCPARRPFGDLEAHSAQRRRRGAFHRDRDRDLVGGSPELAWLAPPRKLWSSSTTVPRGRRQVSVRAHHRTPELVQPRPRRLIGTEPEDVLQPWADTPFFCDVTNQTAANQVESGVWERWKIVPAVTEVFSPHSAHIRSPRPFARHDHSRSPGTRNPPATAAGRGTPDTLRHRETTRGTHG